MKNKNINMSSLKWDLRHTFWANTNKKVRCSKNYFKIFLSQESGASGSNTEKESQRPHPKFFRTPISIEHLQWLLCHISLPASVLLKCYSEKLAKLTATKNVPAPFLRYVAGTLAFKYFTDRVTKHVSEELYKKILIFT